MGADGGIGGTYGVMPELYLKIFELIGDGKIRDAQKIQNAANEVTYTMCSCKGNLYAVIKEILRIREGIDIGGARKPLPAVFPEDREKIDRCAAMIDAAVKKYI